MRIIRIAEVMTKTGLSRVTIWRKEREGKFPARRQLGPNSVGWVDEEVEAWLQARPIRGSEILEGPSPDTKSILEERAEGP